MLPCQLLIVGNPSEYTRLFFITKLITNAVFSYISIMRECFVIILILLYYLNFVNYFFNLYAANIIPFDVILSNEKHNYHC